MSRLYTGRLHPGLEEALVNEVRALKRSDPFRPAVVAVGSNLEALYLRRLLGARMDGHVGVRLLTLIDLAAALAGNELRRAGWRPLPRLAGWRAAARVASSVGPESVIAPVAGRPGLEKALATTFGELVDAGMDEIPVLEPSPSEAELGDGMGATSPRKLRELAELYRRFRLYRDGEGPVRVGRFGAPELLRAAARSVELFPERFGTGRLFVYGFYDFNESQRKLLAACMRELDVVAFLPYEGAARSDGRCTITGVARSTYRFAESTLQWYLELGMPVERLSSEPHPAGGESAGPVPRRDHESADPAGVDNPGGRGDGDPAQMAESAPQVEIVSTSGEAEEAREAAREVLRLAEAGIPLQEMAILYRQPEPYGRLVRETLDAAGIPYFYAAGIPLVETAHGWAFEALLRLGRRGVGLPRFEVMEWVHYAPVNWEQLRGRAGSAPVGAGAGDSAPDAAAWEAISVEAGVTGGRAVWRGRIERWNRLRGTEDSEHGGGARPRAEAEAKEKEKGEAEALLRFVEGLSRELDALPDMATWGEWGDMLSALAARMLRPDPERGLLLNVLGQLRALGEVEADPIRYDTMQRAVGELFRQSGTGVGRFQRSGLTVADVMSVRGVRFRAVFLLGLVEKGFPVPTRRDPILLDEERVEIGAGTLPLKRRRTEEETLLFALATQSATAHLSFFYPRMDPRTGRVRTPSHFLLELAGRLMERRIGYDEFERLPFHRRLPNTRLHPGAPRDALDLWEYDLASLVQSVRARTGGYPAHEVVAGLEQLSPSFQRAREASKSRWGSRRLTPFDGLVPGEILPDGGAAGTTYSASRLEAYARCPHRYFLGYELGLKVWEPPEEVESLSALDRGALVHEMLEGLFARLGAEGLAPLQPENRERALQLLGEQFSSTCTNFETARTVGYPLLWQLERERLWDDLVELLDHQVGEGSGWIPTQMERAFGKGGEVAIELDDGRTVRFRGKIDRLDRSDDGVRARVVDYKTGALKSRHDAPRPDGLTGGMHLQLPIYMLAVRALFPEVRVADLEAWYVYLGKAAGRKRIPFHGTAWERKEADFRTIIGTIVDGIESGHFFPYPKLGGDPLGNCRACEFQRICGPSIGARADRKAQAPERIHFESMREVE